MDALELFAQACDHDDLGRPDQAAPLYRQALDTGLPDYERRRATIQLASSLRNLGRAEEGLALLERERVQDGPLADAVLAFLALCLADCGRERAAAGVALEALAPHLERYNASLGRYAADLQR
jgi:hypothetical protein